MTGINHRRKNRKPVDRRYAPGEYRNGYPREADQERQGRVGRTGFLDKSMHGASRKSLLADRTVSAMQGNDFHHGHRGMARANKGTKKFVRSRIRHHENRATQRLADEAAGQSEDLGL
ncbi:hypothetical protein ACYPKM_03705 [Pseudomonas aeruginosa]